MREHVTKLAEHSRKGTQIRLRTVFVPVILAALALIAANLWQPHLGVARDSWPSVPGKVLNTRISVVGIGDHAYRGGQIYYRAEVEVLFKVDKADHDAWIPASKTYSSRDELEFWLSKQDVKNCIVRWNPRNLGDIEAVLQPRAIS